MVECDDEDPSARKAADINEATSLFKEYLGVEPTVTNAVRIRKKATKPRLLELTLQNLDDKVSVLRNILKLRKEEVSDYIKSIFITADFASLKQQRNKRLRDQLKEMSKDGNHYMIKNGTTVRKRI